MCGIAGYVGKGDEATLLRMSNTLAHRGPDDSGTWSEDNIGLAHTRLAIIDLTEGGHQPMHSVSGSTVIVFNGEIYNYKELREELRQMGRLFQSESDTEVILELFEAFGEKGFTRLVGQFAFALYDRKEEALYLARDRFGEKPLYWSEHEDTLVFGSEPKAILAHGILPHELNKKAVGTYLTYDAVLTPQSMYAHMQKVEAATYIKYKNGISETRPYWDPNSVTEQNLSFEDAKKQLDTLFQKSISSQMVADVPVGVFLSGGLDSSLVAYYAQKGRKEPIHTFSLGFDDPSYDESSYARRVAEHLGTTHHEYVASAQEVRDVLMEIVKKLDEPIADPAILPNYLLARFARQHVTVALGGDGGDELFAGYQTFVAEKMLDWYQLLPKIVHKGIIEPLIKSLPVSHRYFSLDFKAKQFLRGAEVPAAYAHQAWLESFSPAEQKEILTPEYQDLLSANPYSRIDEYLREVEGKDAHFKNSYLYLRTYMQDDILAKVDRSSMYHSLEVRAPFLDIHLAEFALGLPWDFKFRRMQGKYILKKLMDGRLPKEIIYRKKHGFGLPIGSWFQNEWREFLQETLSREQVGKVGVFVPEVVERLISEHQAGTHNHRKKLWSLLVFHLWYDAWIA